ncbi:MAG: hypothetical protein CLLPBCKN_006336 [Chroococcidiopsis cubana SAG 39.79]|uniref:IS110 family transposase n=1 Tax=Chroococcidiopsis cubana SAG 39.79 TaxID=388085 RepID=A0AB37U811_9CYAN|nr:IS110 family transposase [Chroococcidiopsis cubana]MDZ4876901.1 hypothetical protein [Chroococcidiopsis cubana SAG 39.79]RUS97070.1 IS110 family transposase [Chroococcidiopsis cubana SAG 39.79]
MNSSSKKPSYTGKDIFIEIDVHKRTYSVVSVVEGIVVKKWQTAAVPEQLARQLKSYFPKANLYSAYEAGFILHRRLEEVGIKNIVVNAASIETTVHNRVKTDKRDALKIASLLEVGRLKGIRIPSEKEEAQRLLTRTRQQLIEERTAVKNKIRMKCHQIGLIAADEQRKMSYQLVQELLEKSPFQKLNLVIEAYWQVWKALDAQIKKLDEELKQQAEEDPNEKIYRSAPGIGPLGARILSNELGDMSQFNKERQLFSYTGLTPCEHSSGDSTRKGHITRQGNSRVRACVV